MMNVCHHCGLYRADKEIDPTGPFAICPECGHKHSFLFLPLCVVAGASGTGKSAICNHLITHYQAAVLLDADILWRPEFDKPDNNYRDFFETWLRVSKNIAQSGRPVVLFGAGMGVPENLVPCVEQRYFSEIHYLALVCEDEVLAERLKGRPSWRGTHGLDYIHEHQAFNRWFKEYHQNGTEPHIFLLDTSHKTIEETASEVEAWIQENIS